MRLLLVLLSLSAWATEPSLPGLELLPAKNVFPHEYGKPARIELTLKGLTSVENIEVKIEMEGWKSSQTIGTVTPERPASVAFTIPVDKIGVHYLTIRADGRTKAAKISPLEIFYGALLVRHDAVSLVTRAEFDKQVRVSYQNRLNDRAWASHNEPLRGLKGFITPAKAKARAREPLSFTIGFENVGKQNLILSDSSLGTLNWSVSVDGKSVDRKGFGEMEYVRFTFPRNLLTLKPGEKWSTTVTLSDETKLKRIAEWPEKKYHCRLFYSNFRVPFFRELATWEGNYIVEPLEKCEFVVE